jgi:transcription elongation factor Elf1
MNSNQNQPNDNPDIQGNQSKIKTCPHCNSDDLLIISDLKVGTGFVECQSCGATGPEVEAGMELEAWNEREGQETLVRIIFVGPKGFVA